MALDLTGPTVSVRVALPALATLQERGIDNAPALQEAGLQHAELADPDERLPHAAVAKLWEAATRLAGDEALGFAAGRLGRVGEFDVLEYVARNQPTLGEAMRAHCRFARLLADAQNIIIATTGAEVRINYALYGTVPVPPCWSQCRLATVLRVCREVTGQPVMPQSVTFAHTPPKNIAPYIAALGVEPTFDGRHDALAFTREVWEAPVRGADPALADGLARFAEQLIAQRSRETGFVALTERAVAQALAGGVVTAEEVARALDTSPRTLRRRMANAGRNFRELVERVRADLASQYLAREELSIEDVALLLGYSDATAFHRAFRRWTGVTAAEYRRGQRK